MVKRFFISLLVLFCMILPVSAGGRKEKQKLIPADVPENNLALNASFENNAQGWEPLWTREENSGKVKIVSRGAIDGKKAVEISHLGSEDWAFGQVRRVAAVPGEVYEISALAALGKSEGSVQISVVTRTADNKVISWMHGLCEVKAGQEWAVLESRFIVPQNCNNLQLRLTGYGPVKARIDRVVFRKLKDAPPALVYDKDEYTIGNRDFIVRFRPKENRIELEQNAGGNIYTFEGTGPDLIVSDFNAEDDRFVFTFYTADIDGISGEVLAADDGSVKISMTGSGQLSGKLRFPGVLRAGKTDVWTIPQNEGLVVPALDPYYKPWDLQFFQGHGGMSMPFAGLTRGSNSIMLLCDTPDDAVLKYHGPDPAIGRSSGIEFIWLAQHGEFGYTRSVSAVSVPDSNYVGIAKAYRIRAEKEGKLVTLADKQKAVPAVERLAGAADIWWWQKAEWWQDDPEGWKAAQEMKEAGITRALWSNANSKEEIEKINELGYLSGKYDIYQDVWSPKVPISYGNREGWPDDLVLLADGSYMKGWVTKENGKEYPGGVICSTPGLARLKKNVAGVLEEKPYLARFIDTTTASPLRECYNPDHPLTRSGDRKNKSEMLAVLGREFGLVAGSETGIDWAVPYLDYFEGMMSLGPYRLPDAGYDLTTYKEPTEDLLRFQTGTQYRIPLFELVYHDCVVSYWYWGDASNRFPELWRDRDLFNLLYGTGPLYIMDRERWAEQKEQFVESYKIATMTSSLTAGVEMTDHRFLNSDYTVQYSAFANGVKVWVNFGDNEYTTREGYRIPGKGYYLESNE